MIKVPRFCAGWDQRQKEIEAEFAALKAEKDAAIQEKWDHTINQERLAEKHSR